MNLSKILRKYQNGGEITAKKINPEKIQPFSSWNIRQWGMNDYSKFQGSPENGISSFNSAFRRARMDGEKTICMEWKRYHTNLVDKKISDNYWESKEFLEKYYKELYPNLPVSKLNKKDSADIKLDYDLSPEKKKRQDSIDNLIDIHFKTSTEKINNGTYNPNEYDRLDRQSRDIFSDMDKTSQEDLSKLYSKRQEEKLNEPLRRLKQPTYFSITSEKGSMNTDGFQSPNKLFISQSNKKDGLTTPIHELTHKSDMDYRYNLMNIEEMNKYANNIYHNSNYGYDKENAKYLSDPSEINARHQSTRYWLNKNYPNYNLMDNLTNEHYDYLQKNKDNIPYDVKQLLDTYGTKETMINQFKKFKNGGLMKNYSFGGDLGKFLLNNVEQATLGTFGLDFYKPKFDSDTFQQVNDITQKVNGGLQDVTAGIANTYIPGISGVRQAGKQISQFKKGGIMNNYKQGGIMPQNPNDLQAVTENTMEFDGNSHKQGGIPLNNGAELEKNETVIKKGAIGNQNPYAISPNLILDKETAKLVGLPSKYAGMKLSDISRKIEDMKAQKENDAMSEKTNSMNKKFALNNLIKANEILSAKHRQEQGVNEKSDLRQEEMAYGGQYPNGGGMPDDFMDYYKTHPDYSGLNDEIYKNADSWKSYEPDYLQWKKSNPTFTLGKDYPNFYNAQTQLPEQKNLAQSLDLARVTSNNPTTNFTDYINSGAISGTPSSELGDLAKSNPKSKSLDLKSNLGNIGMGLKGASLLANFATIGKKPGQIPAQFNPYTNDILNNYRNSIDNQAIKNDVTSVLNTGLNSNPSRNWNVQRAMNSDLVGKSMEAMSKANLQNQELNNRYRSELGNVENNLGQQNVQAKNMAEVLNAQTQANWRNNLRSAIGNVGNDVADMALKKDYLNKYTDEHIKILNEKGKDYGISFANTEEYLKAITNPETSLILGKIQKGTATPEEIQRYKDIQAGKPVDYTKK